MFRLFLDVVAAVPSVVTHIVNAEKSLTLATTLGDRVSVIITALEGIAGDLRKAVSDLA